MNSKNLTVYWASDAHEWNILYEDPINCYHDLISNIDKNSKRNNFFYCPAFKDLMFNTFLIKNPIETSLLINENMDIEYKSKNYISSTVVHPNSISNNILLEYKISHYFFCEEDIEVIKTSPYFHNTPYEIYGKIVPAKWNCGSWIRPINNEINLWNNVKEFTIKVNEPIGYYHFNTDKKIILKRFFVNEKIQEIASTCSLSSQWYKKMPLSKRYDLFKKSKTNKIILEEIKKNVVD